MVELTDSAGISMVIELCCCSFSYVSREVMSDVSCLDNILAKGANKAKRTAERTLLNCYDAMGFLKR